MNVQATYNLTGTLDSLTLPDQTVGTEQHDTDLASLEVHAHTLDTGGEPSKRLDMRGRYAVVPGNNILDKLLGLNVGQTVNTSNTITEYPVSHVFLGIPARLSASAPQMVPQIIVVNVPQEHHCL